MSQEETQQLDVHYFDEIIEQEQKRQKLWLGVLTTISFYIRIGISTVIIVTILRLMGVAL